MMFPGDVDGIGPPLPCRLDIAALSEPGNSPHVQQGESITPTRQYGLDQVHRGQRGKKSEEGNPVTVLSGALMGPEAGPLKPQLESLARRLRSTARTSRVDSQLGQTAYPEPGLSICL